MKISQVLKFIGDLNPQNTPARLAFYNFLRHFQLPTDELSPDILNRFFCHALEYPHWQTNKAQLGKEIQAIIENYSRFYHSDFDFEAVRFPNQCQIVELENYQDLLDAVRIYGRSITSESDKLRVIPEAGRRAVLVVLHEDGSLTARVFDKKFTVRGGMLEPLRTDMALHYDSNLELKEGNINCIEIAPYLMGQFAIQDGRPHGNLIRGYVFQKFLEVKDLPLEDQSRLFISIKRLEQLFFDRETDPYYQEIVRELGRTPGQLLAGGVEVEKKAEAILERAELAFSEIFIGDKTLALLIKEVRHAQNQARDYSTDQFREEWQRLENFKGLA